MKLKKLFFQSFFLIFFAIPTVNAQVFDHPVSHEDLAQLKVGIPRPEFLRGNFKQTKILSDINKQFVSKGEFVFSIKEGLAWKTKEPFVNNLIFAKDNLIKIEADGTRTILQNNQAIAREISGIFQALFAGDFIKIEEYFEVYFINMPPNKWVIGLKPNSEVIKDTISEIVLIGSANLELITLTGQNEDRTIIEFSNVKTR